MISYYDRVRQLFRECIDLSRRGRLGMFFAAVILSTWALLTAFALVALAWYVWTVA